MKEYLTPERKEFAKQTAVKSLSVAGTWAAKNTVRAVLPWLVVIGIGMGFCGFLFGLIVGLIF